MIPEMLQLYQGLRFAQETGRESTHVSDCGYWPSIPKRRDEVAFPGRVGRVSSTTLEFSLSQYEHEAAGFAKTMGTDKINKRLDVCRRVSNFLNSLYFGYFENDIDKLKEASSKIPAFVMSDDKDNIYVGVNIGDSTKDQLLLCHGQTWIKANPRKKGEGRVSGGHMISDTEAANLILDRLDAISQKEAEEAIRKAQEEADKLPRRGPEGELITSVII